MSNDEKRPPRGSLTITPPGPLAHPGGASAARPGSRKELELRLLINSRCPIISVETTEEDRFVALLRDVATEIGVPLYLWSVTQGLARAGAAALYNSDLPEQALTTIATIQRRYCENDRISRRLRDLADGFRTVRRSIVLLAATIDLPKELSADAAEYQLGLPSAEDLLPGVKRVLAEANLQQGIPVALDSAALTQVARNLIGLPEEEALRIFRKCLLNRGKADAVVLEDVLEAKRTALKTDGLLETVRRDASFTDVAGLQRLREWITKRKNAWTPEGRRFGLVPPKGVLILGVQGCGKSLAARACG